MRSRDICWIVIVVLLVFLLWRQPDQPPRFRVLRGIIRTLTLVLFAEEPRIVPVLDRGNESQPMLVQPIGSDAIGAPGADGYASVNHALGW